jgi:hypothetical protein
MPRPIRYRSRSSNPAQHVFETLAQRDFLEARLAELGGTVATLVKFGAHAPGPDQPTERAEYTLRQGVGREHLPPVIQKVLPGDLLIDRTESWRRTGPGRYEGTFTASVNGAPGKITGTLRLVDDQGGGSELSLDGSTQVPIPLVGGKIESFIAEQVQQLVAKETQFALDWLKRK